MHFQSKQGRILVVDENLEAAQLLQAILQLEGHEVCAVLGGEQALAALENFPADIIVTDIIMPNMNGIELCEKIRSRFHERYLFIISLSGWNDIEAKGIKGVTFDLHLPKPVDFKKLSEAIRFYLIALG